MNKTCFLCIVMGIMLLLSVSLFGQSNWDRDGVRIMCMGDSITHDNNQGDTPTSTQKIAYRRELYKLLQFESGYYNVNFVGTQTNGTYFGDFDPHHEGYAGKKITYFTESVNGQPRVKNMLDAGDPDIILLHIGTNGSDWSSKPGQLMTLLNLIDEWENTHHPVWVLCSTLIANKKYPSQTATFNNTIIPMIWQRTWEVSDKIILVRMDQVIYQADLYDNYHPTSHWNAPSNIINYGYKKMAQKWYDVLMEYLSVVSFDNECSTCKIRAKVFDDEGGWFQYTNPCSGCYGTPYFCSSHGCFIEGDWDFVWYENLTVTVEWW